MSPGTPRVPDALDLSVIVGFAFRFPGASNTTALWDLLAEKRDVRSKIREDRFDMDAYHHPIATNKGTVCLPLNKLPLRPSCGNADKWSQDQRSVRVLPG